MHTRDFWHDHPWSSRTIPSQRSSSSVSVTFLFSQYHSFFPSHNFVSLFLFFATLAVSCRVSLVIRETLFRPSRIPSSSSAPLSFSLPGLPRRHHPPLPRGPGPVCLTLPLPPSAIRRVGWARATRWGGWLVSMETNQLALASPGWTAATVYRAALSLASRTDAGRHGNRRNQTVRAESGSSEFHRGAVIGERTASVYFRAAVIPSLSLSLSRSLPGALSWSGIG